MNNKIYYICPQCGSILIVDKEKLISGLKFCPNCGVMMQQNETDSTNKNYYVAWGEEWTRQ